MKSIDKVINIFDNEKHHYNEAPSHGHVFLLLDENFNPKNQPCLCKDYFQDYFWSSYTERPVIEQYGYSCTPEPLQENYIFAIGYVNSISHKPEKNYSSYCKIPVDWTKKVPKFLQSLSENLNLPTPIVETSQQSNKLYFVTFNKEWTKYPYLVSLLTSSVRLGCFVTFKEFLNKDFESLDNPYLRLLSDSLKYNEFRTKCLKLIESGLTDISWSTYENQYDAHNKSGILSCNL